MHSTNFKKSNCFEVRNGYSLKKGMIVSMRSLRFAYNELIQMLFVIVESTIAVDATYSEELLHHVKTLNALGTLRHYKLMRHLETGFVASSVFSMRLSHDSGSKSILRRQQNQ